MTPTTPGAPLLFPLSEVLTAAEDAQAATTHRAPTPDEPATGPCLWLIAQHGIYLMSNAQKPQGTTAVRAFANGWNEDTDPTGFLHSCGILDILPLNTPIADTPTPTTLTDALRHAHSTPQHTHLAITLTPDQSRYTIHLE